MMSTRVVRAIRAQLGIGSLSSGASFRNRYEVVLVVTSPVKKDANVIERIGCCIWRAKTGKILCGRDRERDDRIL